MAEYLGQLHNACPEGPLSWSIGHIDDSLVLPFSSASGANIVGISC